MYLSLESEKLRERKKLPNLPFLLNIHIYFLTIPRSHAHSNSNSSTDVEFTTFNQQSSPFNDDLSSVQHHDSPRRALNFAAPTADRSSQSEQSSPRVGAAFTPACSLIDCTFDDNVGTSSAYRVANATYRLDILQLRYQFDRTQHCQRHSQRLDDFV